MDPQLPIENVLDTLKLMLPEIFLFIWALVVVTVDLGTKRSSETLIGYLTMFGLLSNRYNADVYRLRSRIRVYVYIRPDVAFL